ncbi:sensor histidine kinase [Geotalea uraniireducens]|uniref:histidine kinase n=1 Tax=Geotalea uraniireducens (strain Rf4) TaxID=351605 RepID=A5GDV6_GEOUR|nr:ATP-binding protein [Geotalea uraniireducens]ABQ24243.1 histidine kinase [Geotalea uraniireducens Rf4]
MCRQQFGQKESRGIRFKANDFDCPDDLPRIDGDEARLHQVPTNIISNALKYSPKEALVSIGARREADNVTIWIKDEGMGIPAELHEKIFEKFYRVDNTDLRMIGGTGLGLALVREIVNAHGGRVWVESAVGKGSTFFVALPIVKNVR